MRWRQNSNSIKTQKSNKSSSQAMAMPTTFIAVQCFQCSTMQVKHQKKSSNKWTCVVCNQKQSVRKVYAQGFMAKDVRKFVTSFNMSRKFADEQSQYEETLAPVCEEQIDDQFTYDHRKRRTDWNEYLDIDDGRDDKIEENGDDGGVFEPKIVSEFPMELFKKPKLKNYSSESRIEGGKGLLRPVFSKRNSTNKRIISQDTEQRPCQPAMKKETSKYSDDATKDNKEPKTCRPSMSRVASKWNDYITLDVDDDSKLKSGRDIVDRMGNWSDGELQALFEDQVVEEDIHPDFK